MPTYVVYWNRSMYPAKLGTKTGFRRIATAKKFSKEKALAERHAAPAIYRKTKRGQTFVGGHDHTGKYHRRIHISMHQTVTKVVARLIP